MQFSAFSAASTFSVCASLSVDNTVGLFKLNFSGEFGGTSANHHWACGGKLRVFRSALAFQFSFLVFIPNYLLTARMALLH